MNPENPTLDSFVVKLIEEKGLEGLDPEVKEQVASDLRSRLEDRINAAILTHLPPDKVSEFNTLLDQGSEAKVQEFVSASIPNGSEVIAEALMTFHASYLNG